MKKSKSAKITAVVFAILIFALVVNIVFLGATGKHLISGENIADLREIEVKKKLLNMLKEDKFIPVIKKKWRSM